MMNHILKKEIAEHESFKTSAYGGAGFTIMSQTPFVEGSYVELKLFIASESTAIFTIGEVIQSTHESGNYAAKIMFQRIRPDDQDIIIKSALNVQAEQLKLRRQQRDQES